MKTTFINNNIEIIADNGEALSVFRQTIYSDRIVVFRTIDDDTLQEVHIDKHSGGLIDRAGRQATLPKFEYPFDKFQLKGIIEHRFLDELDFKDFKPKGVDIETITISLFRDDKRVSHSLNLHPVNKFPANYFESVQSSVDRFVADEKAKIKYELFLKDEYSKWTTQEKANFHHGEILFEDRMQGGYPSGFKNPAAAYLSRWFMEVYQPYDPDILSTLQLIAHRFNIDTSWLTEMVRYDTKSDEWKTYARKLNLLDE